MTAMTPAEITAARSRAMRLSAPAQSPPAMRTPAPSVMAHARVQPAVEQIRDQVAEERDDAVHDDHPHHERVVAIDRALHEIAPRPRQPEHGFDDERTRDDER